EGAGHGGNGRGGKGGGRPPARGGAHRAPAVARRRRRCAPVGVGGGAPRGKRVVGRGGGGGGRGVRRGAPRGRHRGRKPARGRLPGGERRRHAQAGARGPAGGGAPLRVRVVAGRRHGRVRLPSLQVPGGAGGARGGPAGVADRAPRQRLRARRRSGVAAAEDGAHPARHSARGQRRPPLPAGVGGRPGAGAGPGGGAARAGGHRGGPGRPRGHQHARADPADEPHHPAQPGDGAGARVPGQDGYAGHGNAGLRLSHPQRPDHHAAGGQRAAPRRPERADGRLRRHPHAPGRGVGQAGRRAARGAAVGGHGQPSPPALLGRHPGEPHDGRPGVRDGEDAAGLAGARHVDEGGGGAGDGEAHRGGRHPHAFHPPARAHPGALHGNREQHHHHGDAGGASALGRHPLRRRGARAGHHPLRSAQLHAVVGPGGPGGNAHLRQGGPARHLAVRSGLGPHPQRRPRAPERAGRGNHARGQGRRGRGELGGGGGDAVPPRALPPRRGRRAL
ncbi:MAG: UDP-glucose 4-epimerase, partial [uncultured Gemmatimonadetes bacterium]